MISAMVTRPRRAAFNAVVLPLFTFARLGFTLRYSIRPTLLFKVLQTGIVCRELGVKLVHGVAQVLRDCLSAVHKISSAQTGYHLFYLLSRDTYPFLRSEEPVPSEVEGIWANRAMCRVLCHTIIACLARFLF